MFPEREIVKVNDNVFIHAFGKVYRVYFKVNNQYFQIGIDNDSEEDAKFMGEMFIKALEKFRDEGSHLSEKNS